MKNNRNVTYLIENGLSAKTVANLSESQIKLLVEKFKKETKEQTEVKTTVYDTTDPEQKKKLNQALQDPTKMQGQNIQVKETEMTEDDTDDVTSSNALGKDAEQSYTGQEAPHDANDMADDGMDDDSSDDRSMMGMAESKLNEKFESKAQQGLFWARCNKCSDKKCKWCKMAKEFSDSTSKKDYKKMPEKKSPEKTNEGSQKYWENKILEMIEEEKKRRKKTPKKESETMILRNPKKMTMFSNEAPMELPIAKMFSIGKK
jgi:hypothetical protein